MKCRVCGFEVLSATEWGKRLQPPVGPKRAQTLARKIPGVFYEHRILWVPITAKDPRRKEKE